MGFAMASDTRVGALLRCLAASKPHGTMLELGTGTGLGTAWLLEGMDPASRLTSVDIDEQSQDVARCVLGADPRVSFHLADGLAFIKAQKPRSFDLVFADAWAGKYEGLDETLALVKFGGVYVVDDMVPRLTWSDDHRRHAHGLSAYLEGAAGWASVSLDWASGLILAVRGAGT